MTGLGLLRVSNALVRPVRLPGTLLVVVVLSLLCVSHAAFADSDKSSNGARSSDTISDRFGQALAFMKSHQSKHAFNGHIGLIDLKQHSSDKRFVLWDTRTNKIERFLVAHGKGSDPDHDGKATIFSDVPGSKASALGFYRVAEPYIGRHGHSLRMDGLEASNANARSRAIVIHGADYVTPNRDPIGRSWGCPAVSTQRIQGVIKALGDGGLLFMFTGQID